MGGWGVSMEAETGPVLTFNRSDKFYKSDQQSGGFKEP